MVICQALRALALAVAEESVPVFPSASHVVQHVYSTEGGIWTWAENKRTSAFIT